MKHKIKKKIRRKIATAVLLTIMLLSGLINHLFFHYNVNVGSQPAMRAECTVSFETVHFS